MQESTLSFYIHTLSLPIAQAGRSQLHQVSIRRQLKTSTLVFKGANYEEINYRVSSLDTYTGKKIHSEGSVIFKVNFQSNK